MMEVIDMNRESSIRLRVWIDKDDKPFIGPGRIQLLEYILLYGSISKAAAKLKMSYRKAWQLITDMNALSKSELVTKTVGGKLGGGALITPEGLSVIKQYRLVQDEVDKVLNKYAENISM